MADLGAAEGDLALTLLGVDGQPRPELDGQTLVVGSPQSFWSCTELGGLELRGTF